ncbi:MAG: DUF952 domain-containing protein [Rhodoglobus sp.]
MAHSSEWDALNGEPYGTSTRGASLAEVGFIHASSAEQLAGVAERFYRDDPEDLVVLELDEACLGAEVRWEDGGGELFPHIYGPIPPAAVVRVIPAHFEDDGGFVLDD